MLDIAFSDTKENFVTNARPRRDIYHIVALSHTCLKNHFIRQFGDKTSIYRKIIELYQKGKTEILYKALEVSLHFWIDYLEGETTNEKLENLEKLLTSKQHFLMVRDELDSFKFDLDNFTVIKGEN